MLPYPGAKIPFAPAKAPALIKLRTCVIGDNIVFATCETALGKRIIIL